jgi:hypothetical protein
VCGRSVPFSRSSMWNVAKPTSEISSSSITCWATAIEVAGLISGFSLPIAADAPLSSDNGSQYGYGFGSPFLLGYLFRV